MKRLLPVFLSILIFVFSVSVMLVSPPVCHAAEGQYYRVEGTTVIFYADTFIDPQKFDIPKGYSFLITGNTKDIYSEIIYSELKGYVLSASLSDCTALSAAPAAPYPSLAVTAQPAAANSATGFKGDNISIADKTAVFLGVKQDDSGIYYAVRVENNGVFGIYYIHKNNAANSVQVEALLNPTVPPTQPAIIDEPKAVVASDTAPQNNTTLRIILIIGIILPALIIIFMIFRPGKRKQKQRREIDSDDSNRFEDY